jgi:hypothetical protein
MNFQVYGLHREFEMSPPSNPQSDLVTEKLATRDEGGTNRILKSVVGRVGC